jgi:phosphate transport system protein
MRAATVLNMSKHLKNDLERLERRILGLGARIEEAVRRSIAALQTRRADIALEVMSGDPEIDSIEVEIEEECLKILALHQPVANDLRFVTACLKINNDLERIGDQAVNIAQRVAVLAKRHDVNFNFDYARMAEKAQAMLRMSLDALVNLDEDLALKVVTMDDEVDTIQRDAYDRIKSAMKENSDKIGYMINLLLVSRHLERLADHATNIAEEVIYLIEGEIIRHGNY